MCSTRAAAAQELDQHYLGLRSAKHACDESAASYDETNQVSLDSLYGLWWLLAAAVAIAVLCALVELAVGREHRQAKVRGRFGEVEGQLRASLSSLRGSARSFSRVLSARRARSGQRRCGQSAACDGGSADVRRIGSENGSFSSVVAVAPRSHIAAAFGSEGGGASCSHITSSFPRFPKGREGAGCKLRP